MPIDWQALSRGGSRLFAFRYKISRYLLGITLAYREHVGNAHPTGVLPLPVYVCSRRIASRNEACIAGVAPSSNGERARGFTGCLTLKQSIINVY